MSTVSWPKSIFTNPPKTYPAPGFSEPGLRAFFYDTLNYHGKPTRTFAWYGAPKNPTGKKLPAMVLIHGGGGTAFPHWVQLWNSRGYAAIAMDTCGCVSGGEHANRPRHDLGGPAGWGDFDNIESPIEDQWSYHAVADAILAHTLIRSFPEIDPDRIGVTGISWGGYLTCLTAAVDHRFKFAAPVYGCGFLGEDSGWLDTFKDMGPARAQKWLDLWDPSRYLPDVNVPILWVTGTNDTHYRMGSLQKSYRLPKSPRTLCIRVRMPHSHPDGETPQEIQAFADAMLNNQPPLASVSQLTRQQNRVQISFTSQRPIVSAELNFTDDIGPWPDRNWQSIPAKIDSAAHTVWADLPNSAKVYYLNVIDNQNNVVSSEHAEIT